MSGKELDNLFRNKLEELERTPSPKAWDKLQSGLAEEQKKIRYPYWRVAAAILLIFSFVGLFLWSDINVDRSVSMRTGEDNRDGSVGAILERNDEKVSDLASEDLFSKVDENSMLGLEKEGKEINKASLTIDSEKTVETPAVGDKSYTVDKTPLKQVDKDINLLTGIERAKHTAVALNDKENNNNTQKELNGEVSIASDGVVTQAIAKNNEGDATSNSNTTSSEQDGKVEKSTALVFDIEEFDKKTAVAVLEEGAQEEVKQSKFKKILNFVKNVKEGDGGMAGIREAKDELFAFDAKKKEDDSE